MEILFLYMLSDILELESKEILRLGMESANGTLKYLQLTVKGWLSTETTSGG